MAYASWRMFACALALLGVGCVADEGMPGPPSSDGPFAPAADRRVVADFDPDVFPPVPEPVDAAPRDVAPDGPADMRSSRDTRPPAPDAGCSLIRQDCPDGGCYPAPSGRGECAPAGHGTDGTICFDDRECAPGYLCVDGLGAGTRQCWPACDATADAGATGACGVRGACTTFPGSAVGYCAP